MRSVSTSTPTVNKLKAPGSGIVRTGSDSSNPNFWLAPLADQ
jgi:hypothetical protein